MAWMARAFGLVLALGAFGGTASAAPPVFDAGRARASFTIDLPEAGAYGVGMIFLPQPTTTRSQCQALLEQTIAAEGQTLLGWRDVPVDHTVIGRLARDVEPNIRQAFIGRGQNTPPEMFEWKLRETRFSTACGWDQHSVLLEFWRN